MLKRTFPDLDSHQMRRCSRFGMNACLGMDHASGLVHEVDYTAANAAGITQAHTLLHGEEDMVSVDSGYRGAGQAQGNDEQAHALLSDADKPLKVKQLRHTRGVKWGLMPGRRAGQPACEGGTPGSDDQVSVCYLEARYRDLVKNGY